MADVVPQAGGVVVRRDRDRVSVLLVTAKKDPSLWIFPKGHIERGETAEEAALREVEEEAGVVGEIIGAAGDAVQFQSGKEWVRVEYFVMRARSESPRTDGRSKRWFPVDDAVASLRYDTARATLRAAIAIFERAANTRRHS